MDKLIRKYALQNALRYDGKANPGAVIGKVLSENPGLKDEIKQVSKNVNKIIKEVNKLSLEKQKEELESIDPELLKKKKKEEKDIFAFLNISGKITTAFPPEPSKYPHIGHAKAILLNYELARRYNGRFILRFEDTNPKLTKEEFYKIHLENYRWLGIEPDKIEYASDYIEEFYKYAEKLVKSRNAYLCCCSQETIKKSRFEGLGCECRENLKDLKQIFDAEEGSIVLRLKLDMKHKNTAMRDPALLRIIDYAHPRLGKKYRVWPTYDFENAVMDGIEKITHRLRSKEFELRNELQRYIQKLLGFNETHIYEFARFNLEGVESSGRLIREKIANKELIGWDDPSLTTMVALKRRGFLPEAIKNFVLSTGITKSEATLTWDDLIMQNRRLLDPVCDRYFFVWDPIKIEITNAPEQKIELDLHPDKKQGGRSFKIKDEFYITKNDFEAIKDGKLYRFMDCLNFTKKGGKFLFHSLDYEGYRNKGERIMHWLPADDHLEIEILMPDKKIVKGFAEKGISVVKPNQVIQFERFGFCRLDSKNKFWYTHK